MAMTHFPEQTVLCAEQPVSLKLLGALLEKVFASSAPVTGYLRFSASPAAYYFLFFFNGAPYAAGAYVDGQPLGCTIGELGRLLQSVDRESLTVSFSETDPVLFKNLLLLLHKKPLVKATTELVELDAIVRQFGEGNANGMIALCRNAAWNFFFFRNGKAALAHYADGDYKRPAGKSLEEELHAYAYQSGAAVEVCVYRDMAIAGAEDARNFDRNALLTLLSGGKAFRGDAGGAAPVLADTASTAWQPIQQASATLRVESGPQQGETYTVQLPCLIGRKECDLVLNDSEVSRRHAELKIIEHTLVIEDLMSTNGTQVNGMMITRIQLAPNDLITVGDTSLKVIPT